MRNGMVIDLARCTGCHACAIACKAQHGTPTGVWWSKVLESEEGTYPSTRVIYTPVMCMHCENAPCVNVCPSGASYKDEDGSVQVDYDKCIGCRYCEAACPYDARTFVESIEPGYSDVGFTPYEEVMYRNHQVGVVEKCNLCKDVREDGSQPACVRTCPAYARHFGDLDDPTSEVSQLVADYHASQKMPELGTNPAVYYLAKTRLVRR